MLSEVSVQEENIPLFNTIALEISSKCNRACDFCPVVKGDRPDEEMSSAVIEKAVNELVALKYKGRITPYVYNEPMRDKRLLHIMGYISHKLPRACSMVSTNGDYIHSPGDISALYSAGVRQLVINIYSHEKRFLQMLEWTKSLDLDHDSSCYTYAKKGEMRVQVLRKFGDVFDGGFKVQNRSGNIPDFLPALEEPLQKMCVRPWRFLNINWKGQGILCCNDYHGETNFGNLNKDTLVEIWNHMEYHKIRSKLQKKDRNVDLCKTCDYNGGSYPHMIHPVKL